MGFTLSLLIAAAVGQTQTGGTVKGTVTRNGIPLQGATVTVGSSGDSTYTAKATTDGGGNFAVSGTDPDGDGFSNELTRADITAVSLYQATMPVPGRVIPNDPEIEAAVLNGEGVFDRIGARRATFPNCHSRTRDGCTANPIPTIHRRTCVQEQPNPSL